MTNQGQMPKIKCQSRISKVKALNFALLILVLLLSGCFGYFKKKETPKPAAPEPAAVVEPTPAQSGQAAIPEPPSFQDGDYYLQALSSRSLETCAKIRNEKLKVRCDADVGKILQ